MDISIHHSHYIVASARFLSSPVSSNGVKDAPALAQADVGVAIGAGTDIAIETADIILVKSKQLDFVSILSLSKNTYRKMVENLLWQQDII